MIFAIILGRRKGYENTAYRVHNIPFVALGAFILWFGWFGFNAGSALGANGLAAHAFLTSAIASASAMMSWMLIDVIKDGKPTLVGASTGLVVGLVAITPGAGFVPIWSAFIIGALVSPICCGMITLLKKKLKIDDALDAFEGEVGLYYLNKETQKLDNDNMAILKSFPNVILSPHMAFYTEQAVSDMVENSIKGIIGFECGEDNRLAVK